MNRESNKWGNSKGVEIQPFSSMASSSSRNEGDEQTKTKKLLTSINMKSLSVARDKGPQESGQRMGLLLG